jgi:GNAT superfamily N-acetyltransferase
MTDIMAAIGLVQLNRFDGLMAKRKHVIRMYDEILLPLGIHRLQHVGEDYEGNGHLYLMRLTGITEQRRNEIIVAMAEAGVACNVHFKPLPLHTAYKRWGCDIADYPNTYKQYANEITLPLHTHLTDEQVHHILEALKGILEGEQRNRRLFTDELKFVRVYDSDLEHVLIIQNILTECGERMFLDDGLLHWATPLSEDAIRQECTEKEFYVAKSKRTGEAVATFNITTTPSPYYGLDKKSTYLNRLAVTPKYWSKGIATQCVHFVLEKAARNGSECIRGIVYEASDRAVTFLKRRGFREVYKRPTKHFVVQCMELSIIH